MSENAHIFPSLLSSSSKLYYNYPLLFIFYDQYKWWISLPKNYEWMKLGREKNLRPTDRRTSSSQRLKSNGARYDAMTFRTSEVRCALERFSCSGSVLRKSFDKFFSAWIFCGFLFLRSVCLLLIRCEKTTVKFLLICFLPLCGAAPTVATVVDEK